MFWQCISDEWAVLRLSDQDKGSGTEGIIQSLHTKLSPCRLYKIRLAADFFYVSSWDIRAASERVEAWDSISEAKATQWEHFSIDFYNSLGGSDCFGLKRLYSSCVSWYFASTTKLSNTLQATKAHLAAAVQLISAQVSILENYRSASQWDKIWNLCWNSM